MGVPFPAAIAVMEPTHDDKAVMSGAPGFVAGERLLVADNLSDDVLLIDAATGKVVKRFDLSESDAVPWTYPVALAVSKDGTRGFVALWNASEVVELDLVNGDGGAEAGAAEAERSGEAGDASLRAGDQPGWEDAVCGAGEPGRGGGGGHLVQGGAKFAVKGYFDTRLPGQSYFGAEPVALAVSADGSRLYVANMGSDAVAVIDTRKLTAEGGEAGDGGAGGVHSDGVDADVGGDQQGQGTGNREKLYVATDKGRGTGPNNFAQKVTCGRRFRRRSRSSPTLRRCCMGRWRRWMWVRWT